MYVCSGQYMPSLIKIAFAHLEEYTGMCYVILDAMRLLKQI